VIFKGFDIVGLFIEGDEFDHHSLLGSRCLFDYILPTGINCVFDSDKIVA
jgi:hypothetical protein